MANEKSADMAFNPSISLLRVPNIFIYDTGATCDTTFSDMGMTNTKRINESTITYGNGSSSKAEKKGDLSGVVCNKSGQAIKKVVMKDVKHVPNSKHNLFTVSQGVANGWMIGGDKSTGLFLQKGGNKIVFDILIDAGSGIMACMYLKRNTGNIMNATTSIADSNKLKASSPHSKSISIKVARFVRSLR